MSKEMKKQRTEAIKSDGTLQASLRTDAKDAKATDMTTYIWDITAPWLRMVGIGMLYSAAWYNTLIRTETTESRYLNTKDKIWYIKGTEIPNIEKEPAKPRVFKKQSESVKITKKLIAPIIRDVHKPMRQAHPIPA